MSQPYYYYTCEGVVLSVHIKVVLLKIRRDQSVCIDVTFQIKFNAHYLCKYYYFRVISGNDGND